ncbi:GDSL esterase/lipase APG [Camellia lanceoleosa]|uniref:GDSL esterase/lipase APG n=1 Tax=Camellia lanceoleosa TaxID=1840588 RepID=A0ACC0I526_9ERIC|nr:GDSL esterase/lipase APG [Camellia lanceoleosa]
MIGLRCVVLCCVGLLSVSLALGSSWFKLELEGLKTMLERFLKIQELWSPSGCIMAMSTLCRPSKPSRLPSQQRRAVEAESSRSSSFDSNADTLGFTAYPPAYLSPQASGKKLLLGANFASAGSGYDDKTAFLSHAIPLSQQLEYYKEYQAKLAKVAGNEKARSIIKDGLYILSAGNSDFLQNYYVNPFLYKVYTPYQYSSYIVSIFSSFVKRLYNLGARRIGVTSFPPLGCVPLAITLFGMHESGCVSRINTDAQSFNKMINSSATNLQKQLPGLKIVVFDIYKSLHDLVKTPSNYGFAEARRGCCGTGIIETTWLLCNPKSIGT